MRIFFRFASILLMMTSLTSVGIAQDFHFTDFRRAPTTINPALTGGFEGTYRVNGIYRDQWRGFGTSNPYKTFTGSVDVNIKAGLLLENDWLSTGMSFLNDNVGTSRYKTTLTGMQIGYHYGLDKDYNQVLSAGINIGNRSVQVGRLWGYANIGEEQIDYLAPDANAGEGIEVPETVQNGQGVGSNISFGVSYKSTSRKGDLIRVGVAMNHLNSPDASIRVSRGGGQDTTTVNPGGARKLNPVPNNLTLFAEGSTLLSKKVRLNPALLLMNAAGNTELQVQATADYLINPKKQFALTGGLGVRAIPWDAAYLMAGFIKEDISVRLSYDLTLSQLSELGGGGAFEISVGYIGRIYRDPKKDEVLFCPRL